jgi:hypothetical protein
MIDPRHDRAVLIGERRANDRLNSSHLTTLLADLIQHPKWKFRLKYESRHVGPKEGGRPSAAGRG